jgi:hypothetical protein
MTALRNTRKTTGKLIEMARELTCENGSFEWADATPIMDADEMLDGVKRSEILRAMFFGSIEEGVGYPDALVRWNGLGNLEIVSPYTLENEAWDERDEILDNYREAFGTDRLDEALTDMDTDATDEA